MSEKEHKPSGMEMMIINMLKAAGLNVNDIKANIENFATGIKTTLQSLGDRLTAIDAKQAETLTRLEALEKAIASKREGEQDGEAIPAIPFRKAN
jgi:hypothetical protein